MQTKTKRQDAVKEMMVDLDRRVTHLESLVNYLVVMPTEDELLSKAITITNSFDEVSAPMLQRELMVGYARAARIIDQIAQKGFIEDGVGGKPRRVIRRE